MVQQHGLGHLYEPGNAGSLERAVRSVLADETDLRANVVGAQDQLSWREDADRLLNIYENLG